MPILPFAEWLPDQPSGTGSTGTRNVIARTAKSYGPMPSPVPVTLALPERAMGDLTLFSATRQVFAFVASQTKIHRFFKTTGSDWEDVSKAAGYSTLSFDEGGSWDSTAFGDRVIFTNYIDPVQSFDITSSTDFADLAAAAPKARYCCTIRDFLFLAATNDPVDGEQPRRVWWSSIGQPDDWPTPGTDLAIQRQSDFQDLEQSELGHIRGVVGGNLSGADAAVFMERGVIRVTYQGSPSIFSFDVAEGASGTNSPWSIVSRRTLTQNGYRAVAYYLGEDGWLKFDGQSAISFGAQKFDRFFFDDCHPARRSQVLGCNVPNAHLICWAYHSRGNATSLYDRLLVYSWEVDRATLCEMTPFEWLQESISGGLSLDDLDPFGTLETITPSFDSMTWQTSKPVLGLWSSDHRFNGMDGLPMAATVETTEAGAPGRRTKLHGTARPLIEGSDTGATVAVGRRERQANAVTYDADVPISVLGSAGMRSTGRYFRLRLKLPAGTEFNHLAGIEAEPQPEGRLR